MRLLLDTHTFLWFSDGDAQLSVPARRFIEDSRNDICLSIASVWEIAIKISTGKLALHDPPTTVIAQQQRDNDIALLGIAIEYIAGLTTLPFHHRDPFDRLLIVQAMAENMPIISADEAFDAYAVTQLW